MKKTLLVAVLLLLLSVSMAVAQETTKNDNMSPDMFNESGNSMLSDTVDERMIAREGYVPGQVIVKLKEGILLDESFLNKHQLKSAEKLLKTAFKKNKKINETKKSRGLDRMYLVKFSSKKKIADILENLNKDSRVEYAEPDYILSIDAVPNDPSFPQLWGMDNTGQTGGTVDADIDAPEAWDIQTGSSDVVIAVIDTGVDYNHSDLVDNIWTNPGEIPGDGIDNDGNGIIDDIHGYNAIDGSGDPMDDNNHGTHCAGTIAAVGNNGIGVIGVNWNASIMPVKFLNAGGGGYTSDAVEAIIYATLMEADIMSNSWGGGGYSLALEDAISAAGDAGIIFVAAAGNNYRDSDISPAYPASYDLDNIVSVAATDHNDNKASFSNWGIVSVDLGAPGVSINSTMKNGTYGIYSGTSMACPHVAGVAGLIKAQYPDLTGEGLKVRLLGGVDIIPSMEGKTVTGGRLNAYNSLENDDIPPAEITDLAIADVTYSSIGLSWEAVGDDGLDGTASVYDIRYSTSGITDTSWDSATQVTGEPNPNPSEFSESFTVENLEFGTTYYFAIKAVDNMGNAAGLSNVVSGSTTIPTIAFSDDMESGLGWTSDGLWHHETYRYNSPISSWAYNTGPPYYTYNTGTSNSGSLTSSVIDLSDFSSATLAFEAFYQTEGMGTYWDRRKVQVGIDGVFTDVDQLSGDPMLKWNAYAVDISSYAGKNVQVRFSFDTIDGALNDFEGWYIDDVSIFGESSEENLPPVANAGPDQTRSDADGDGMETIILNGFESYDPDGEIVSFVWGEGTMFIGNGSSVNYDFPVGTHVVTLSVEDNNGMTDTDEIVVTVNPNQAPIANAGPDQSSFVGTIVNFDGSESFDPDGDIVSYEWNFGDGTATGSGIVASHSYGAVGNYTVVLTVTDNGGATATDISNVEIVATDVVIVTKAQYDSKKDRIIFQATSSGGGEATLEVFTVGGSSYGNMSYNLDRNLFILTVENIDSNPGTVTVKSSLGGEDEKEVTNKFKK